MGSKIVFQPISSPSFVNTTQSTNGNASRVKIFVTHMQISANRDYLKEDNSLSMPVTDNTSKTCPT